MFDEASFRNQLERREMMDDFFQSELEGVERRVDEVSDWSLEALERIDKLELIMATMRCELLRTREAVAKATAALLAKAKG